MIIYVDMDGVVALIEDTWLFRYNSDFDDNLQPSDIIDYGIHKFVKKECGTDVYRYLGEKGFFLEAKPDLDGCSLISQLHDKGHNIYFLTKIPSNAKYAFAEKREWLDLHLPLIGGDHLIGCSKKTPKGLLSGDFLIEDYWENFKEFKGNCILIDRPWNRHIDDNGFIRCYNWKEVEKTINIYSIF